MRNDSLDELEHIPSLQTEVRDQRLPDASGGEEPPAPPVRSGRAGRAVLRLLLVALTLALGSLGWWTYQRLTLMEQQLVATQESFARISEDAALRIQSISGKVVAAESSVTIDTEALKLQVRQLANRLSELEGRQRTLQALQDEHGQRLGQLAGDLQKQRSVAVELAAQLDGRLRQLGERVQGLADEQLAFKGLQAEQARLATGLEGLDGELAALKKRPDPAQAIGRLEQELLVLRSQLDNAPSRGVADTAEFDAFRAQTTRRFTALQNQLRSLQQQLGGR